MLKTGKMRFLSVIMSMALIFSVMPADYVEAEETTVTGSGICGAEGNEENVIWSYDSDGTLTISGTGAMADYDGEEGSSPLSEYRNKARKIIIGEGITSIGSYNFYQFNEVEEIEFPKESLKHIGDSAFAANFNLRHITIPESVETLGSAAFSLCEHLEEIRIPGNISRVPEFAFTCNGWGAKNIVLEEGVTEIASHAFASVYLQRLELPDTVTSIASDAFTHYNNCSPVVYGKTEYIKEFAAANDWAYVDVSNAYDIKNADIRISNRYLYTGQEIKPIPEVIYHINEKDIILCPESDYKLEYSNNIECGTASVTITGLGCYTGSKVITYEIFQPTSGDFGTCGAEGNENNVIWLYDGDGTLTISGTGAMADFEESGSPWYKFRNKTTKIIIEDGVTSIGAYSFYKFVLVEEIEYPKYSLNHIGEWAFAFNEKLHNVEIPKSVQSIGYDAYVFCSSLENVRISGIIYSISSDMFIGCYNLKSIVLEEGVTVIGERAFADSTGIQKIELPGTITKIAANAFCEDSSPIVYGKTEYTREFAFAKDWIYVDASNPYDIKNADVRISSRYLYTGQEIKPIPEIIYHINGQDIMLYPESDYKLEYSNNIECGTASVTITGLGCYTGSKVVTYEIFQPESMEYGTCGAKWNEDNVIWSYDSDGTLTISGTGAMADYGSGEGSPWWKYRNEVKKIVIEEGITAIGTSAFAECKERELILPETSLSVIRECAFWGNDSLQSVTLPETLKTIEYGVFDLCSSLKSIVIPGTVEHVEGFKYCTGLETVVLSEGVKELDSEFVDVPLSAIYLPVSLTKINSKFNVGVVYGKSEYAKKYAADNGLVYRDGNSPLDVNECLVDIDGECIYSGEEVIPEITVYTNINGNRAEFNPIYDYRIEYADNVERGTATATIWGLNDWLTGSKKITYDIYTPISDCEMNLSYDSVLYDGTEKKPEVKVKFQGETLTEGTDYSLVYDNNTEEGTATVTVSGKGIYKGSKTLNYRIYKNSVEDCKIELSYDRILYDGTEKKPEVEVKFQEEILTEGTDYSLVYNNNTGEGTATVTVSGKGIYKGVKTLSYHIYRKSIEQCEISLAYASVQADGTEKKPAVTVKDDTGVILKENTDYVVEYYDMVYPGEAMAKVTGTGSYKGNKSVSYSIEGVSIENAEIELNETIFTYDGSPKRPSVYVKLNGKTLVSGTDYNVSYKDNTNDGTAYVIITGTGIYKGAVSMSFTIIPYSAGKESVYDKGDTLISGNYIYEVTDDEDFELELSSTSNKNISDVVIPATVKSDGVTYKVTSIGEKAFYRNTKIKKVTIGNNVESIENYAFYGCKNITSVKFGKNVEVIGSSSFRKCTKLTSITLPKSMEELGKNAFYGCKKLKTITINASSVIDIEENAIKGISKKAVIKVPSRHLKKYKKQFKSKTGYKKTMKIKKK